MRNDAAQFQYNLGLLADTFKLNVVSDCRHLTDWTTATFELSTTEQANFEYLYEQVRDCFGFITC